MSRGPFPYEDVYLDEQRSSEEEENDISETPSKPLMSGRKKSKIHLRDPKPKSTSYYRKKKCCLKIFYSTLALISLTLFVFVLVKVVKDAVTMGNVGAPFHVGQGSSDWGGDELIPCTGFDVEQVWVNNFPTLTTETAVRMVDVNRDGILDVILGFGTMAYGLFRDQDLLCQIYYEGESPCFGGMMALDGISGKEIWRHYSIAEIFAVNCEEDINMDGVKDCLGAGRAGEFELVNGATGEQIWTFENNRGVREIVSNLYTPQYIDDINNDDIPDIVNVHGGDPARKKGEEVRSVAKVIIFSGKTGSILAHSEVPDKEESYYSPQVYSKGDGSKVVLFGTGGETRGGSLYAIPLENVTAGSLTEATKLYSNPLKGVMTPPVLVDLTNDGVVDIVSSIFNGTVIALNGETYDLIWNTTVPFSESYSTPGAGYFNDDEIPDFMIVFNYGPGYPLYYYSQVTILDGKTGLPLIDPPMKMSGSVQSSSLSISFEGFGNDAFIYWGLLCEGHEHETTAFTFADGVFGPSKSRVNFCKERFGTKDVTRQFVLNQNMKLPGDILYDSQQSYDIEHTNALNATVLAMEFLKDHPEIKDFVIKDALERHSHSDETDQHSSKSKHLTTVEPSDDQQTNQDTLSDREVMEKFMTYLEDNFDEDERQAVIQQLLADNGYLDDDDDDDRDVQVGGIGYGSDDDDGINEQRREFFENYHPQVLSDNKMLNDRRDGKETYPQILQDYFYSLEDENNPYTGPYNKNNPYGGSYKNDHYGRSYNKNNPYRGSFKKDRRKRESSPSKRRETKYFTEDMRKYLKDSQLSESIINLKPERRKRRHLGAHDAGGVQRLIATGSLAPPLDAESVQLGDSIDTIFPVYWFFPSDGHLVLPEEEKCISQYMDNEQQRMDPDNKFYGLDHDGYINRIEDICIKRENKEKLKKVSKDIDPLNVYPFNIDAGIMTVYRLRLTCKCKSTNKRKCAKILPFDQQKWPSYVGRHANSIFDP